MAWHAESVLSTASSRSAVFVRTTLMAAISDFTWSIVSCEQHPPGEQLSHPGSTLQFPPSHSSVGSGSTSGSGAGAGAGFGSNALRSV